MLHEKNLSLLLQNRLNHVNTLTDEDMEKHFKQKNTALAEKETPLKRRGLIHCQVALIAIRERE